MTTLRQVKNVQPQWFSKSNKRFFGDISYKILHGRKSNKPFLIRLTSGFSDMFNEKTYFYCINKINDDLKISGFVDGLNGLHKSFKSLEEVKDWLKLN